VAAAPVLALAAIHQVTNAGNDPFAGCTAGTAGTNYPRSEVEPYASINPANPSNIVAVVQQDRWSNGGAHGLVAGVSTDRGSTWSVVPLPFSACAANAPADLRYERAAPPGASPSG
jgi:hypothetical protein